MNCGQKIKQLRLEKQLSQKQLGEILNVSDKTISKWETGRTLPDIEMIQKIAQYFHVSIDELINQRKGMKLKTKKLIISLVFIAVILLLFILVIDIQNMELFITVAFIDLLVMIVSIGVSLFVDFHHRIIIIMKYISLIMIVLINVLYMMCIFGGGVAVFIKVDMFPVELILLSLVTGFLCGAS